MRIRCLPNSCLAIVQVSLACLPAVTKKRLLFTELPLGNGSRTLQYPQYFVIEALPYLRRLRFLLTKETWVYFPVTSCEICSGLNSIAASFLFLISAGSHIYNFTIASGTYIVALKGVGQPLTRQHIITPVALQ
jgi:hypothetical protein